MGDIVGKSIQHRRAAQMDEAARFLDEIGTRKPETEPRSVLVLECVRLREIATTLLDILGDVLLLPPAAESEQERMRDELLADVPAACRGEGGVALDDVAAGVATLLATTGSDEAAIVRGWLRAARAEGRP